MLLCQFPLRFHQQHKTGCPVSSCNLYDYSRDDWDGLRDHLRDVHICIYIPHRKYQVKPPSSPLFSAACAAAIVHRNHFFVCTNKVNLLNIKESSDRLVFVAKGFLKLPDMHMLIELPLPRNLALGTFGELLIVFSTKVNLLYLLY